MGGVVVGANPESELLAALLVGEAQVQVQSMRGSRQIPLADFLRDVPAALNGGLVTAVSLATGGKAASARVARTPVDTPIVAAVARQDTNGQLHLALCGVAATPVLIEPDAVAGLNPPADFRGSSEYRRQMAQTLAARVVAELN
ncbi:MAG: FAD binding domain-containing protein [Anaerolineae bacterium]